MCFGIAVSAWTRQGNAWHTRPGTTPPGEHAPKWHDDARPSSSGYQVMGRCWREMGQRFANGSTPAVGRRAAAGAKWVNARCRAMHRGDGHRVRLIVRGEMGQRPLSGDASR
jgi:hypothetical protein